MTNSTFGGIKIEGIELAVSALKHVGDALGPAKIQQCLLAGAIIIRDRARALVRIGPGVNSKGEARDHLKDAIFAVRGKLDPSAPSVIAGVSIKRAPHAHLVEYGHDLWKGGRKRQGRGHLVGHVTAHPFLRPALDQSKKDIPGIVEDEIKSVLRAAGIW